MFEVGFSELLLICVIALIVLGPQRLPKLAQQVGRWMGRARSMARQFRDQLEEEAHAVDIGLDQEIGSDSDLANKKSPANKIATPEQAAAASAAVSAAVSNAEAAAAATAEAGSPTLTTGIPPEDDFAHRDAVHDDPQAETARTDEVRS